MQNWDWFQYSFIILGVILIIIPLLRYRIYQWQGKKMELDEIYDDDARKRGTLLLIIGGILFFIIGLFLLKIV